MSRLVISNAALLKQAATSTGTQQRCTSPSLIVRRWKSLAQQTAQQQRRNCAVANSRTATSKTCSGASGSGNLLLNSLNTTTTTSAVSGSIQFKTPNNCRAASTAKMPEKFLQLENINPNFIAMEYAVRGPLVIRAGEIENELKKGAKKPFDRVIRANIGDCHAMGQKPVTFVRQLLALTYDPSLLDSPLYPEDVKKHARELLQGCQGGSVGSYTDSAGIEVIRRQVAAYIQNRDGGIPSDWRNIFLTAGATPGIKSVLSLLRCTVNGKKPGVLVPIPQYPLYSATLAEFGIEKVDYFLEEETGWSLKRPELERALAKGKTECNPRAIVVINPGNPTGQVLTRDNIVEIIKFAYDHKLVILADEVYQDNIYDKNSKFFSFKKVLMEMGAPYNGMEMASFLSTSKGYLGECGIRGGYMEILNMDPKVMAMLAKSITASLCGTTAGQIAVSALVNPPKKGDPSYEQYISEKNGILAGLKERAELVYKTLSSFEGYKVNPVQGAMYVFPQIEMPKKAIEAAKAKGMPADTFYAFELLESTGICIVSGSGFGQKPGTYHFRSTILPQIGELKDMMNKFQKFHAEFMKKYN